MAAPIATVEERIVVTVDQGSGLRGARPPASPQAPSIARFFAAFNRFVAKR
jgi:hypothetical protein